MTEERSIDMFEFLKALYRKKVILIVVFVVSFISSYFMIRLAIPPEYDSTATIISSEDNMSSLMKDLKNLPLGLGGKSKTATQTDLFKTLIYSRTNLEKIINKFDLVKDYKTKYKYEILKIVGKKITVRDDVSSFSITVRANSPQKAADMVNFIIDDLNKNVIEFNTRKSRLYREFIEKRYAEIKLKLSDTEDKLNSFQKKSGIIDKAQKQAELIVANLVDMEKKVITKQMELNIKEKTLLSDSPLLKDLRFELEEYKKELNYIRDNGNPNSPILALNSLPDKIKEFARLYRDVEIQNTMLATITPMYEQAKMDEQKDIPVMQIIDRGDVAEKKAYPPRSLFAGLIAFGVVMMVCCYVLIKNYHSKVKGKLNSYNTGS